MVFRHLKLKFPDAWVCRWFPGTSILLWWVGSSDKHVCFIQTFLSLAELMAVFPKEITSTVCVQKDEPSFSVTSHQLLCLSGIFLLSFWQRFPVAMCGGESCDLLNSGWAGPFTRATGDLFAGSFGLSLESAPSRDGDGFRSFLVSPGFLSC